MQSFDVVGFRPVRYTLCRAAAGWPHGEGERVSGQGYFPAGQPEDGDMDMGPDCVACGAWAEHDEAEQPLCGDCQQAGYAELDEAVLLREGDECRPVRLDVRLDGGTLDVAVSPHRGGQAGSVSQVLFALTEEGLVVTVWSGGEFVDEHTLAVFAGDDATAVRS